TEVLTISIIIPLIFNVPIKDFLTTFVLNFLLEKIIISDATQPIAAASVGVAIPKNIKPITLKTMINNGNVSKINDLNRLFLEGKSISFSFFNVGAKFGLIKHIIII